MKTEEIEEKEEITEERNIYKLMDKLARRIRIVRSARIEASKRYKEEDNFYRFVTIFYSIIITVVSIRYANGFNISSGTDENSNPSILLLVISVFVTLFSMYVSIKNAGEKVGRFRSNYMELTRLLADIQLAITTYKYTGKEEIYTIKHDYKVFTDRYASLLNQSDNHDDIDYRFAIIREEKDDTDKIKTAKKEIKQYQIWKYAKRMIAFLSIPLLYVLLSIIDKFLV